MSQTLQQILFGLSLFGGDTQAVENSKPSLEELQAKALNYVVECVQTHNTAGERANFASINTNTGYQAVLDSKTSPTQLVITPFANSNGFNYDLKDPKINRISAGALKGVYNFCKEQ